MKKNNKNFSKIYEELFQIFPQHLDQPKKDYQQHDNKNYLNKLNKRGQKLSKSFREMSKRNENLPILIFFKFKPR